MVVTKAPKHIEPIKVEIFQLVTGESEKHFYIGCFISKNKQFFG